MARTRLHALNVDTLCLQRRLLGRDGLPELRRAQEALALEVREREPGRVQHGREGRQSARGASLRVELGRLQGDLGDDGRLHVARLAVPHSLIVGVGE